MDNRDRLELDELRKAIESQKADLLAQLRDAKTSELGRVRKDIGKCDEVLNDIAERMAGR